MNTIFYSLSISLFDSLSTTQQIIIFVLLLTTIKPLQNSLCYLAGLSGAYFACGLAGYMALGQLRIFLNSFFPTAANISNPLYYQSEFLTGIIMAAIGIWYFRRKKKKVRPRKVISIIMSRLRSMNGWFAFGIGVFISVTSFPVSVPYLVALGKYTTLHLGPAAVIGYIVMYNIGYALPMILVLIAYLIIRHRTEDFHDTLHEKARMLNVQLTTWTFAGFGLFLMIDAGCYFAIGHALIKGRYF